MRWDGATIRQRAGRALATAAVLAASWAIVVALSGGVTIRAGASPIASRDPFRPLLVAVACAAIAAALLGARESRRLARGVAGGRDKAPARIAAIASASILVVSVAWNTRAAGGSDSSCYVLQAQAFAHGRTTLTPPLTELAPGMSPVALAPTGFVPSPAPPHAAVPICAPGLALVMVPALLGGRDAVFLVVPLFAAMAVWCTFLLGRAVEDDVTGACAAVLLACSPIFLYQSVQPMSDVPALALWLAALVALRPAAASTAPSGRGRGDGARQMAAGLCASAAVLTRPNVALIVLPLLALLPGVRGWVRFGAASLPLLAVMAALNAARYGAPLASGYGDTDVLFSLAHVGPNLARYPRWLLETHTPFIALAAFAPLLSRRETNRRLVLVAASCAALTLVTYLAYSVFDDWWYIRFLLPAISVMLVLSVKVARWAVAWLLRSREEWRPAVAVMVIGVALSVWFVGVARQRSVFDLARLESRFRVTGEYAGRALPANAIVLSVQQSGSIRYYGDRGTLAWDALAPDLLDGTLAWLRIQGYVPFIALEDGEDARFRERFAGQDAGRLDWPPMVEVHAPVRVRIHDPAARLGFIKDGRTNTQHIWK